MYIPSIFVIIALSLACLNDKEDNKVQVQPQTQVELCKQSKLKREKEIFLGFQRVNKRKEKGNLFVVFAN